jgi:hypothetical protein
VLNVVEEVSAGLANDFERDAIMLRLPAGEVASAFPLDASEVAVDRDEAMGDAGSAGKMEHAVNHGLGIFAARCVEQDKVIAGEIRSDTGRFLDMPELVRALRYARRVGRGHRFFRPFDCEGSVPLRLEVRGQNPEQRTKRQERPDGEAEGGWQASCQCS